LTGGSGSGSDDDDDGDEAGNDFRPRRKMKFTKYSPSFFVVAFRFAALVVVAIVG